MNIMFNTIKDRVVRKPVCTTGSITFLIVVSVFVTTYAVWAGPKEGISTPVRPVSGSFAPGEKLTYSISWSKLVKAGIAVMEVTDGRAEDGRHIFRFISRTTSVGLLEKVFPVRDTVESIVDAGGIYSLSYNLRESHGTRKRQQSLTFDHKSNTVKFSVNNGEPKIYPVPEGVHDALSSLYYVRTLKEFIVGKPIIVDVHDSDKNWSVAVHVLGKERVTTPAGVFDTIKIKTFPKYDGVFMNKGDIFIWFTDDAYKIPVLMQSTISIGSIVATLTEMQPGKDKP